MGVYLNPGNEMFLQALKNQIYVDKSLLIEKTNELIGRGECKICVSRPRRFGKSTDANMLVAYYSKGCDSSSLFHPLKIHQTDDYRNHLNKHNVIHLNMQDFLSMTNSIEELIDLLTKVLIIEIKEEYESIILYNEKSLSMSLSNAYSKTKDKFIFIIDEWDCVFRSTVKEDYEKYLDFLRNLLKDKPYVELAYMTGILPIKKYGTHSALNMFKEISMIEPFEYSKFMGFTEQEVKELCEQYQMNFKDMQTWYNGYQLADNISVYNPRSVVYVIESKKYGNYWTSTETYEALSKYINMNYDGLKDMIVRLLANEQISVDTGSFLNDMTNFKSADDILTLLIHLGYLGYHEGKAYIPNQEVVDSFVQSVKTSHWDHVSESLMDSQELLEAIWDKDEKRVAAIIQKNHYISSVLEYNNEKALAFTILFSLYTARNHYTIIRECPAGKGFADIAYIPLKDKPAMIVELKWNQNVETAINQIKNNDYPDALKNYKDNLLIVGINYDKETKEHICCIE